MGGFCGDCGNTICVCNEVKAENDRIRDEINDNLQGQGLNDLKNYITDKLAEITGCCRTDTHRDGKIVFNAKGVTIEMDIKKKSSATDALFHIEDDGKIW
jgi:hypothetical protein